MSNKTSMSQLLLEISALLESTAMVYNGHRPALPARNLPRMSSHVVAKVKIGEGHIVLKAEFEGGAVWVYASRSDAWPRRAQNGT